MGILEKIKEIEEEMARTQKNKATEYHLGTLKAKLAKLRRELLDPTTAGGSSKPGEGFDVRQSGDARVVLIGFPSTGKSTLLNSVTKTRSEAAAYEYTTLTAIPGVIEYQGSNIQLLDLPGILSGAASGVGRGKAVVAVARTADLVLMMLDASKPETQKALLEKELEEVGIRLNKTRPDITIKLKKGGGGLTFNPVVKQSHVDHKMAYEILHSYKMHNADVLLRQDVTVDEFIDVILGNRRYVRCLYVYSKADIISIEEVDRLSRLPNSLVISCNLRLNLETLIEEIWANLGLLRIYTKKRGEFPDLEQAVILKRGATVEDFCNAIHKSLAEQFRYGLVWGTSAKHTPQRVGLQHVLADEDVCSLFTK